MTSTANTLVYVTTNGTVVALSVGNFATSAPTSFPTVAPTTKPVAVQSPTVVSLTQSPTSKSLRATKAPETYKNSSVATNSGTGATNITNESTPTGPSRTGASANASLTFIIGTAVGGGAFIIAALLALLWLCRRRSKKFNTGEISPVQRARTPPPEDDSIEDCEITYRQGNNSSIGRNVDERVGSRSHA